MKREPLTLPIAVVIATKDRPAEISNLLGRLSEMGSEFKLIVVSDSSSEANFQKTNLIISQEFWSGRIFHLRAPIGSLTVQKNLALDFIAQYYRPEIEAVQILDDDTLPHSGFIAKSYSQLISLGGLGISGLTSDLSLAESGRLRRRLSRLFGIAGDPGKLSKTGIGIPHRPGSGVKTADWLIGCSMWTESALALRYNPNLLGSCLFEDVEFSVRSPSDKLFVDTELQLEHQSSSLNRPDTQLFWFRFAKNRFELVKISQVSLGWYLWGNFGLSLQILLGSELEKRQAIRGLVSGTYSAISKGVFR